MRPGIEAGGTLSRTGAFIDLDGRWRPQTHTHLGGARMTSKALTLALAAVAATAVAARPAQAQGMKDMKDMKDMKATTISAQVIDLACYVNFGLKGEGHRECAQVCADAGLALGFLGSDGNVYIATEKGMPGPSSTPRLKPHAEHTVEVTGMVNERSGTRSITIESMKMTKK